MNDYFSFGNRAGIQTAISTDTLTFVSDVSRHFKYPTIAQIFHRLESQLIVFRMSPIMSRTEHQSQKHIVRHVAAIGRFGGVWQ